MCMFRAIALAVALLGQTGAIMGDEDIVLPPVQTSAALPERLLILLPGGLVPTEHYRLTAQAIQNATIKLRLTVVIPEVSKRLCSITCPSKSRCSPLRSRIASAVAKSTFKSKDPKEDTFVAGHSLGAICANNLVQGNKFEFAGLLEFAGWVDMTGIGSIANYPIPVLHMAGEVDGSSARVSTFAGLYAQSKTFAEIHGWEAALKLKPVHVLEGIDHSDFCPGFFVTAIKDCKSEVAQSVSLATIGSAASAFLHLNSPTSTATHAMAILTMKKLLTFTQQMCDPFLTALQLEKGPVEFPSSDTLARLGPWCEVAQQTIAGLSPSDAGKLKIEPCTLVAGGPRQFEHQHANYSVLPNGHLDVTCFTAVEAPLSSDWSLFATNSVDCLMISAARVAQELDVVTNASVDCAAINRMAVEVAKKLLPAKSRRRYEEKGRGVCFMPDSSPHPIFSQWAKSEVGMSETKSCLLVVSSTLDSPIAAPVFPGTRYCKFFSPSKALDWMMTDSHKPFPYPSDIEVTRHPSNIPVVTEIVQI